MLSFSPSFPHVFLSIPNIIKKFTNFHFGIEATRQIRSSTREDHDIPIFAMTANTFTSDRRLCEEAGMNGYIPKPVNLKDIESTLKGNMNNA